MAELQAMGAFGLTNPTHVPPKAFREVRVLTRYRFILALQRARVRNRVHNILDRSGVRMGGVLSHGYIRHERPAVIDGLAEGLEPEAIL